MFLHLRTHRDNYRTAHNQTNLQFFQSKKISDGHFPMLPVDMGGLDSYEWLRGERRACHNKVITRTAGFAGSGLATRSGLHSNG